MKFAIPEISWHNRDPVLSVDFQPNVAGNEPTRLATGGTDSHVLIWYISTTESGSVNLEVAADLTRHQKAVNVVRWSPNGKYLASGDDESIIFIWKQKNEEPPAAEQGEEQNKESWVIHKTLRGHMEDVLDISWCPDSLHLASGSVDNKLLLWDITKGKYSCILTDHKGFVQGVAWDPKGQLIATASTDRTFRTFDVATKKVLSRSSKGVLPFPSDHPLHNVRVRLYHDDTLQTYYRRLQFSPDGLFIAVPAGRIEAEQGNSDLKPINAVYIYTRFCLKVPACVVPCGEPALALRWSRRLAPRAPRPRARPALPGARLLLAVATKRTVMLYDTQQRAPIALISNIHYTRLTDLTWSPDGRTLVASSTDGFCSVIMFKEGELGQLLPNEDVAENKPNETTDTTTKEELPTPTEKSPNTTPPKTKTTQENTDAIIIDDDIVPTPTTEAMETSPEKDNNTTPKSKGRTTTPKNEGKLSTPKNEEKISTPKSESKITTPKSESKNTKRARKSITPKIDSFITFKAPGKEKSDKKQQKTPVKIDLLVETAMPSWSDNSNNDIIRPTEPMEVDQSDVVVIEDSEDMKLVYEDTCKSQSPTETDKAKENSKDAKPSPTKRHKSPERKVLSPKQVKTPTSSNFLAQAKVTDVKQPGPDKVIPSPKAPRRVSFVTLSSPKNKKKC